MDAFKQLFGINKSSVRKNCVLMPFQRKVILERFGFSSLYRGKLYAAASNESFTLIHTGMGPALMGDAVLYLGGTPCQNLFLLGACGLTNKKDGLDAGVLVTPAHCYAAESFTRLLLGGEELGKAFYPDRVLQRDLLQAAGRAGLPEVTCLSIGSLKLQTERMADFLSNGIEVLDMECAAFFAASEYIGRRAAALFIITDIIQQKPFYRNLKLNERLFLFASLRRAANILCKLIEKKQNA